MPRRSIMSAAERDSLLAMPDAKGELIRHYTFNETDLCLAWSGSAGRRHTAAIPITAGVVAHQSYRGLPMAEQYQGRN